MKPRRILHVIPTLDQSGAEKQLSLLAIGLPADRFTVSVCALTRGGHYETVLRDSGIEVTILGKRFTADPIALGRLTNLIHDSKPDIVHSWLFAGNAYARVAAILANQFSGHRPKLIASERCVDVWKRPYQLAIDRKLANATDAIIANSQAVASFYQRAGVPVNKLRVIANAVEATAIDSKARAEIRHQQGVADDEVVVGFIGRLWPQKRVQDLIWAYDVLRIAGWEAPLWILGAGPRRAALERLARNLEIEKHVRFLGHRVDNDRWMQAMDILALPSQFEGMPNVVLEAMRAGKPVVASRIPGMDEVVQDGETGILVEPKQPVEIARSIRRLLEDDQLRQRMGAAGQRRANEIFTVARMVEAHAKLYDELTAEKP